MLNHHLWFTSKRKKYYAFNVFTYLDTWIFSELECFCHQIEVYPHGWLCQCIIELDQPLGCPGTGGSSGMFWKNFSCEILRRSMFGAVLISFRRISIISLLLPDMIFRVESGRTSDHSVVLGTWFWFRFFQSRRNRCQGLAHCRGGFSKYTGIPGTHLLSGRKFSG